MKATVYLSRKLLNQLKVKETESKDLMLTHLISFSFPKSLVTLYRAAKIVTVCMQKS